jgi:ribosomal-protein-alanine N-acetyltransferase
MLGSICYWNIVPEKDKAEIGYEMHSKHFGNGIMQEAIQCIIDYGFNVMQLKTIEAFPLATNSKSIRLLEKNSFVRDYTIEQYNLSEKEKTTTAVYVLNKTA